MESHGLAPFDKDEAIDTLVDYAAPRARPLAIGSVIAERYRIDRFIDEGGMAQVFEATNLELPKTDAYGAFLDGAFPGAVQRKASIMGPGYVVVLPMAGVSVAVTINHVQGQKRPVAHTSVTAHVATRGLDIELSRAQSLPSYMEPKPLLHAGPHTPGLSWLACLAAPSAAADEVLLPEVLDTLAQHLSAHGVPGELIVSEGKVELSYSGWPSDQRTIQSIAWLVGRVASLIPPAIDSIAGPGGTLDNHPEVLSLRARRAKRRGIGLVLLAVVGGLVLVTAVVIVVVSLAMQRR